MKRRFAIIAILFSLGLLYLGHSSDNATIQDKISAAYKASLDNIIVHLNQSQDTSFNYLSNSQYYITIQSIDSTQSTIEKGLPYRDHFSYVSVANGLTKDHQKWNLSLPISALMNHDGIDFIFEKGNPSTSDFKLGDEYINIALSQNYDRVWARTLAWLLFLSVYIGWAINTLHREKLTLVDAFIGIVFTGLHYSPLFTHWFEGFGDIHWLGSWFKPTMPQLIVWFCNFWILSRWFVPLKQKINTFNQKDVLWSVIAGLSTAGFFVIWARLIKAYVVSPFVNFDMDNLLSFNLYSLGLIIFLCLLTFVIFQLTYTVFKTKNDVIKPTNKNYIALFGSAAIFCLASWYVGLIDTSWWKFVLFIGSYILIMDAYVETTVPKITYLIWWLILYSAFLSIHIYAFGIQKDIDNRTSFAQNFYSKHSPDVVKHLESVQDTLINRGIFTKIASLDFPLKLDFNDLDQYLTIDAIDKKFALSRQIELYDDNGQGLFSNRFSDYPKTTQLFSQSQRVGKYVFYNPYENKYIVRLEISPSSMERVWRLFLIYIDLNDLAGMLKNGEKSKFNYAIFNNKALIESNNMGLNTLIKPEQLESVNASHIANGYSYIVHQISDVDKIVTYKRAAGLIKPISLFSFVLTLTGLITLILSTINTRFYLLPAHMLLKFGPRSSLKTKIQLAIIFLILFTFVVIGMITTYYFKNLIEAGQDTRHRESTIQIADSIAHDMSSIDNEVSAMAFIQSKINTYAHRYNKEINIYDTNGIARTVNSGAQSAWRMPHKVIEQRARIHTVDDTDYIALAKDQKPPFAYLSIQHKDKQYATNSILDFLSTILNAYIFLFLIAGAIAITIANSITQPLSYLTEKLKKFKLGQSNERLEWQSNDEIGTLIDDYNNLTREVERSAHVLAKTQRDMAWREMAKQVAHEIKNPLTPMKLHVQYLERTVNEDPAKAKEMIQRISSTLVEQIDNLTQIANEFSNFATMPQATNEKILLNDIVEAVFDLFRKRDDMDINLTETLEDMVVFADRNHLVRILNNLLKNAIQAIPEARRGKIDIELKRVENNALIRVSDNGVGIPDHMREKVFAPNFTTKSSGTGLGLAIAANMIESCNGRIYFETQDGVGTDFFISIPLMRLDDYLTDDIEGDRIELDS
jgi:two-component system, NtrC family, nitrogen regulation sensor histidine kinase NtrY